MLMERVKGIEPSSKAWEALVLPLNYTRKTETHYSIFRSICKEFRRNILSRSQTLVIQLDR